MTPAERRRAVPIALKPVPRVEHAIGTRLAPLGAGMHESLLRAAALNAQLLVALMAVSGYWEQLVRASFMRLLIDMGMMSNNRLTSDGLTLRVQLLPSDSQSLPLEPPFGALLGKTARAVLRSLYGWPSFSTTNDPPLVNAETRDWYRPIRERVLAHPLHLPMGSGVDILTADAFITLSADLEGMFQTAYAPLAAAHMPLYPADGRRYMDCAQRYAWRQREASVQTWRLRPPNVAHLRTLLIGAYEQMIQALLVEFQAVRAAAAARQVPLDWLQFDSEPASQTWAEDMEHRRAALVRSIGRYGDVLDRVVAQRSDLGLTANDFRRLRSSAAGARLLVITPPPDLLWRARTFPDASDPWMYA